MTRTLFILCLLMASCIRDREIPKPEAWRQSRTVTWNQIPVDVVIDKPALSEADVLILYHGTVLYDSNILKAASNNLDNFKAILERKDMMLVSVAYPGENLLLGDNIIQAEAALMWVKQHASAELGIKVKKIFLAGHSQGAYLVTRLNTMHETSGVIANAPGPLNLVYRCELEESGKIPSGVFCTRLRNTYGTTTANPTAYFKRSLLNFTMGFKSDILFVQGMDDSPIQMYSWPAFRADVENCKNCRNSRFLEIAGGDHEALFDSPLARDEFNTFINSH